MVLDSVARSSVTAAVRCCHTTSSSAAVGGLILWFGWYGFNPGSTLSAMDFQGIGRVAANTTLAACAAGMSAMFYGYPQTKKWDLGFTVNGFLAGLVAITCPCYWVSPLGAVCIGLVAGVLVVMGVNFMEWMRIDDPIGAVPVHGFCGIWGTLSLGLFACGRYGLSGSTGPDNSAPLAGLLYHGGVQVLEAQIIGSVIVVAATLAVSFAMMYALKAIGILRVSEAGELEGLDLHEHGIPAYPEFPAYPERGRRMVRPAATVTAPRRAARCLRLPPPRRWRVPREPANQTNPRFRGRSHPPTLNHRSTGESHDLYRGNHSPAAPG